LVFHLKQAVKWLQRKLSEYAARSSESSPSGADTIKNPIIIARSDHNISRANISRNAVKVLYRLKNAGYEAYLVGGGVRDLGLPAHTIRTRERPFGNLQLQYCMAPYSMCPHRAP